MFFSAFRTTNTTVSQGMFLRNRLSLHVGERHYTKITELQLMCKNFINHLQLGQKIVNAVAQRSNKLSTHPYFPWVYNLSM